LVLEKKPHSNNWYLVTYAMMLKNYGKLFYLKKDVIAKIVD
jgi:hypothetical protein